MHDFRPWLRSRGQARGPRAAKRGARASRHAGQGLLFRLRFRGTHDDLVVQWDISPRPRGLVEQAASVEEAGPASQPAAVETPAGLTSRASAGEPRASAGEPRAAAGESAGPPAPGPGPSSGEGIGQAISNLAALGSGLWQAARVVAPFDVGPPSSPPFLIAPRTSGAEPTRRFSDDGGLTPPDGVRAMRRGDEAAWAREPERMSLGRVRVLARRKAGAKRKGRRSAGPVGAAAARASAAPALAREAPPADALLRSGVRLSAGARAEGGRGVLAVSCLAVFMSSLNITALYVAFADIGRGFAGASMSDLSWVLNAYTIVFSALLVPAGRVADRLGHKRAFLAGLGAFCAASALCGAAPSVAMLVGARVLQACGAALLMPASLALVLGAYPAGRRASALGIWSAVSALAAAFGPALGSIIVQNLGWRWAFFVNVPIGLYTLARGRRAIADATHDEAPALPDSLGAVLLVTALSALSLGAVKSPEWGWSSPGVVGSLLVGAAASAAFVARSRRVAVPALDLALFADRSFSLANFATFAFSAGFTAAFFGNVLFLTQVWGYSLQQAGLAVTPGPLAVVPVAIVGGRLADRYGYRPVLIAGGLVTALGGVWLAHVTGFGPNFLGGWLPGMALTGAGVGLVLPAVSGAATASMTPERLGLGGAVNQAVRQFGAVLGVAIVAALLSAAGSAGAAGAFAKVYGCLLGAGLLAALCGVVLPATKGARGAAPSSCEGGEGATT